ncbi:hypothetical protein [Desulfosporosinus sp. OT]|uniref:hypothetical protein n=1 Tax=Desulfosporosinus sp. OT TaxID=913865 RepID=UPI000223A258|nr:hypothetical protein [Desulfosporosinus sp. OT]EGW41394.1 hypothetical protein DOT_0646 [Desulfosporosinus sp. OT]
MIIRSIKLVTDNPHKLHFHVITTPANYATVAFDGCIIEVFEGEIPSKELDDLEMAIRSCASILPDIFTPFSELSKEQLDAIAKAINKRLLYQFI